MVWSLFRRAILSRSFSLLMKSGPNPGIMPYCIGKENYFFLSFIELDMPLRMTMNNNIKGTGVFLVLINCIKVYLRSLAHRSI